MEIISKSNKGFRLRPSFQKIASKPNKQINYVVNPNQAVRDSYEFSNLINGEIDIEDELKKQIADEIVHNEIQKEIARRQVLEKEKEEKTAADLRGTIPTSLPEMSGAAATRPEFFDIATETTSPAYRDTTVDEEEPPPEPEEPPPEPEEPQQTRRRVRVRVKQGTQPMTVDDEVMEPAQTTGEKRQLEAVYENKQTKIRKAKLGTLLIRDFPKLINDPRMTINAIKQQLIMYDVAFEQDTRTKKDLEMIVANVEPTKWKNEVPETEIIKRLKNGKTTTDLYPYQYL